MVLVSFGTQLTIGGGNCTVLQNIFGEVTPSEGSVEFKVDTNTIKLPTTNITTLILGGRIQSMPWPKTESKQ